MSARALSITVGAGAPVALTAAATVGNALAAVAAWRGWKGQGVKK